jgi:hypothetical protein
LKQVNCYCNASIKKRNEHRKEAWCGSTPALIGNADS